jgi:hypothetical protein
MKKFKNLETTLISKWYNNLLDELVSEHPNMNETELICLLSETIENRIKEEQLSYISEGFVSELIGESFNKIDYAELIQYYRNA